MSRSSSLALSVFVGLMLGVILSSAFRQCRETGESETIEKTDTLIVRDTVIERYPEPVEVSRVDTMLVAVRDTVVVRDTAFVVIGREQRYYESKDYRVWISGYKPHLDSVEVFPQTKYIHTTKETISRTRAKRWGIGIQAGYGVSIAGGKIMPSPYIGVGISYDFIRF